MFLGQIRGDSIFRGARPFHIHFGGKEWAGGGVGVGGEELGVLLSRPLLLPQVIS